MEWKKHLSKRKPDALFQGNPYGLKDATGMGMTADMGAAWGTAALQPAATGYYPYDPTLAAYG